MGNCGTKPKTSDGDDAPPPAQPPAPAPAAEEEIVAVAPEEASQAIVAPPSEVMISNSLPVSSHSLIFGNIGNFPCSDPYGN